MTEYHIYQSPDAIRLAKELVSIATNQEFGDLRNNMVESRLIGEIDKVGGSNEDLTNFIGQLLGTLVNAFLTVEVLSDEIATARNQAQAVADDPRFKSQLEAMARELNATASGRKPHLQILDDPQ